MNLKQQLVVKTPTDEFEIWSKKQYDEYIAGCVEYGAGSAYRIVTHFNEDENLLKDSPYQGSAADYEEVLKDHDRLVREIDVILNGEEGAAKQASLCDLVGQIQELKEVVVAAAVKRLMDDSAAAPAGDGWVSVEEQMPEHNIGVLVFIPDEDDHITSGMWDIEDKWVLLDDYRVPECEVTHWRPLPSPPNKSV